MSAPTEVRPQKTFTIYCNDEFKEQVTEEAARRGLSRGQFTRLALSLMMGVEPPVPFARRDAE
ncbi:CopG family transcriptional regulator [Pseudonocardia alni]|uniref:ribbon-helix-helix domain-containing protein n=1 Tax=Pseudonocardia alni TaxID=33907 RepID=UPI0033C3F369